MNKICIICKKIFSKPYTCSKKAWLSYANCSQECKKKAYPLKATIICMECGQYFQVRNYRKDTAHFCSKKCSYLFRDEGKRTADKKIRQSVGYKAWRSSIFKRDNFTCTKCGIKNGQGKTVYFHADHIKPFALYPLLRFEINNGRTLCVPCHIKTGTYGRGAIYRNKLATA